MYRLKHNVGKTENSEVQSGTKVEVVLFVLVYVSTT